MKKYYDHGTKVSDIRAGDWVLVKDECRQDTLAPIFKGPYLVAERRDVNLHLSHPTSSKTRVIHINRCRKAELPSHNTDSTEEPGSDTELDTHDTNLEVETPGPHMSDVETPFQGDQQLRRSTRLRRPPQWYGDWVNEEGPPSIEGESDVA